MKYKYIWCARLNHTAEYVYENFPADRINALQKHLMVEYVDGPGWCLFLERL